MSKAPWLEELENYNFETICKVFFSSHTSINQKLIPVQLMINQ